MFKIDVEHTEKKKEKFYIYLYPFGKPNSKKLPKKFLYVHQMKKLFEKKFN
jgi:hypothetical protein